MTTTNAIQDLTNREYKWASSLRRRGKGPQGIERGHSPADFVQERRAGVHAGVAVEGAPLLDFTGEGAGRAGSGRTSSTADQLSGHCLLLCAKEESKPEEPGGAGPGDSEGLREAGHPARRAKDARGRGGGRGVRQRFVATTFKEKLAELGIIFCSFSEAVREHPALVQKYLGSVVPYTDNFSPR